MNISKLFSKQNKSSSVDNLLKKDDVKNLTDSFVNNHLDGADGIIIIWATDDDLFIDTAGLSEAEVIGSLQIMGHRIEHDGVSK